MKSNQFLAEEALKRLPNRYMLVNVLARYVRLMPSNSDALIGASILDGIAPPTNNEKATTTALKDFLEDKIKFRKVGEDDISD